MSLFWLCLPISYVLCGCFHKNITKKAKLCSWQPVWVNNQRAHGCFACIGCLSPVRFGLCLYPERLQTMLWYHNAQLYLLNNQHNEYNWALWHHSIVWCSFATTKRQNLTTLGFAIYSCVGVTCCVQVVENLSAIFLQWYSENFWEDFEGLSWLSVWQLRKYNVQLCNFCCFPQFCFFSVSWLFVRIYTLLK